MFSLETWSVLRRSGRDDYQVGVNRSLTMAAMASPERRRKSRARSRARPESRSRIWIKRGCEEVARRQAQRASGAHHERSRPRMLSRKVQALLPRSIRSNVNHRLGHSHHWHHHLSLSHPGVLGAMSRHGTCHFGVAGVCKPLPHHLLTIAAME